MTQAAIQSPPSALPQVPAAPAAPGVRIMVPGVTGSARAYTSADIDALRARKSELSNQINSADARRKEVQHSLRGATGADKTGLEARLGVLDTRIARLESDIDENSSQLASLDVTRLTANTAPHWGPDTDNRIGNNGMPLAVILIIVVLVPLMLVVTRNLWKRGSRPVAAALNPDTTQRLERIEQAMDAIAIEIERVSEGQRFVTRLMSEGRAGALGTGQPAMEPVPVPVGGTQFVERR